MKDGKATGVKVQNKNNFYGVQVNSAAHMTRGGVIVDERAQVINNDDKVIDSLYTAGEEATKFIKREKIYSND